MSGTDRRDTGAPAGVWPRRAGAGLATLAVGLALVTMIVVILAAFWETRSSLSAVRLAEAETAAEAIHDDLDHAIALGIPLDRLPGLDAYLAQRMARLSELRFVAILDAEGRVFHRAAIGQRLEEVLAGVGGGFDPSRHAIREVAGYQIVSFPLRDRAGWVLVASQPAQILQSLTDDLLSTVPFWSGCLVLVGWWAWVMAQRGLAEPARVLGEVMERAVRGRFDILVVRRARDAMGDCQWAANAAAAGLYARERNFLVQAEEVRAAVFDPTVAMKVVELRDAVAGGLVGMGGSPPRRVHGTRMHDADPFAGMVIPSAVLGILGAHAAAARSEALTAPGMMLLAGLVAFLAGLCGGLIVGRGSISSRRTARAAVAVAVGSLAAAALAAGWDVPVAGDRTTILVMAGGLIAIMGGVIGAASALATRCRKRWVAERDGASGTGGPVPGPWGMTALVSMASLGVGRGLTDSPTGLFVAGLALCLPAAISAAVSRFGEEPAEAGGGAVDGDGGEARG